MPNKKLNGDFSPAQIKFFKLLVSLGYLSAEQTELLWSVINSEPLIGIRQSLQKWTHKGFLKASTVKNQGYPKHFYVPIIFLKRKLSQKCGFIYWRSRTEITSHNTQAIEAIVQGLYTARFKYQGFRPQPSFSYWQKDRFLTIYLSSIKHVILVNRADAYQADSISVAQALHTTTPKLSGYFKRWFNQHYRSLPITHAENKQVLPVLQSWLVKIKQHHPEVINYLDYLPFFTALLKAALTDGTLSYPTINNLYQEH